MNEPYIGTVILFCGTFAPRGWALCNGQLLSISQYTALFSILGTTYGGDGVRTFALPDLRGRVPIHAGQAPGLSPYAPGQVGGTETTTLNSQNMPAHTHTLRGSNAGSGKEVPGPNHVIGVSMTDKLYTTDSANAEMRGDSISVSGSSLPFNNVQPYLALNFIIATEGLYPPRP